MQFKSWKMPNKISIQFRVWLTVKVWPAIEIVPDRDIVGFGVTRNVTAALPLIESAVITWIHMLLLFTE